MKNFWIWRRFRDPKDLSGTQDRALTRNELHTWLEELASESNTIQAQGILTRPGRFELQTRWNYMYFLIRFSLITLDWPVRLGSGFVCSEIWSFSMIGNWSGALENPYEKVLCAPRWFNMWSNEEFLDLETFPGLQRPFRGRRSRADAQQIPHTARRTGFRVQYYTGTRNSCSVRKIGVSNPVKLYILFD